MCCFCSNATPRYDPIAGDMQKEQFEPNKPHARDGLPPRVIRAVRQ